MVIYNSGLVAVMRNREKQETEKKLTYYSTEFRRAKTEEKMAEGNSQQAALRP